MLLFISFHLCRFHSVISVSMNWNFKSRLKNLENSLTFTIPHFAIKMITLNIFLPARKKNTYNSVSDMASHNHIKPVLY